MTHTGPQVATLRDKVLLMDKQDWMMYNDPAIKPQSLPPPAPPPLSPPPTGFVHAERALVWRVREALRFKSFC